MAKKDEENLLLRGALSDLGDSNEELKKKIERLEQEKQVGLDEIDRLREIIKKKKEWIDKLERSMAKEFDRTHSLEHEIKKRDEMILDMNRELTQEENANVIVAPCAVKNMTLGSVELAFHNLFILICNWESSIIERTWPMAEYGTLTTHFQAKFSGFCNLHGNYASANAILSFYMSLGDHYKKDLCAQLVKDMKWRKDFSY